MAKAKNHSARKHALLSASGASRWMNCTPSARLEEKFPEKRSSYADEGTLAHELADLTIGHELGLISKKVFASEMKAIKANPLFSNEMPHEVDKYTRIVLEAYSEAKKKKGGAEILIEERLDFSHVVEKGFGTGDIIIVSDGVLEVTDLKYGKGVRVDADDNFQLKLYGIGALRKFDLIYNIHTVKLRIVQPRLDHLSEWEISAEDLRKWGETEVKDKAKKAYSGEGIQTPGEWCKFCKAKSVCRALAEENLKLAEYEFRDPHFLSDKEILAIYEKLGVFKEWANSVESHIKEEAIAGKIWPGYKLVEGRSNRRWVDEEGAKKVLSELEFGFSEDEYLDKSLKGITAIEKLVGKTVFNKDLGKFVKKPQGAPTLVKDSDKRPGLGVEQAKLDFSQ